MEEENGVLRIGLAHSGQGYSVTLFADPRRHWHWSYELPGMVIFPLMPPVNSDIDALALAIRAARAHIDLCMREPGLVSPVA
jgi:hypothetical protein